jgi:hypothetical protein
MAKRIQTLAELGITRAESALFTAIYYGCTVPPAELPRVAVMEDYWEDGSTVTEDECGAALTACLAKGWLQIIDAQTLARIVEELQQGRVLGPIYGLPAVGAVDFTAAGAALFRKEFNANRSGNEPPPYYEDTVEEKFSQFFRSERAALSAIEEIRRWDEKVFITGPSLTGPWRFAAGFQVDFEQRRQWQARAGGSLGQYCNLCFGPGEPDLGRLQHVLDCHNVSFAEWLLLFAMEGGKHHQTLSQLLANVADDCGRKFGVEISEEQCRIAMEACLHNGWLRIIDQDALDEIDTLLQSDSVLMPVPQVIHGATGDLDFTPPGALLYKVIMAQWRGPDWEDLVHVEKQTYQEQHYYCQHYYGFGGVFLGMVSGNQRIRVRRIGCIGPWCVKWWERYGCGFRLELEVEAC